jgi:glyoxylase-like metal-dependent hydrolase (beta-lactamase superfamily II)
MTTIHRIACPIPFPLKTVNCYYIADSRPTLIDSGVNTPESMDCIEAGIRQAGGRLQAVRRVIVTHAHTDHVGLAGRLAGTSGAEVFIHRRDYPKFISTDMQQSRAHFQRFRQFLDFCGVPGSEAQAQAEAFRARVEHLVVPLEAPQLLSGGETLGFDDFELQVVHTPGHSAGSISLLNAADGTLFSGDFLLEHITPNPVAEFSSPEGQNSYGSLARFTSSLQWLVAQDVAQVRPGHGSPFTHARQRGVAILNHFVRRRKQVIRVMAREQAGLPGDKGISLSQLVRLMFPGLKEMAIFLGLSEAYAYLQRLESEALLDAWCEQGIGRYRLKQEALS